MSKNENQPQNGIGKNIDKPLLTVKEVATHIGESVHVIRNWYKELKAYIPVEKSESGYNLYGEPAIEVVQTIQRLHRDNGYSMKQIEHYLATGGKEFIPVSSPMVEETLAQELQEVKETLDKVMEKLEKQEDFNRMLTLKLDEQQSYIESLLNERDRHLLHAMQEIEKKTLQLAAASEESHKKWWQFWK